MVDVTAFISAVGESRGSIVNNLFSEQLMSEQCPSVQKRRGDHVEGFSLEKIEKAVSAAFTEVQQPVSVDRVTQIALLVKTKILMAHSGVVSVEDIQDLVESTLMEIGAVEVAKSYILYRSKREGIRDARLVPDPTAISDYIHPAKYSRYLAEEKRRETYKETVARVEAMHLKKFPLAAKEITEAFDFVRGKKVLPSMRSMQFAGEAIESINARQFNCCFLLLDKMRAFKDTLYLLLCGSGVGYSVQYDHVDKLPKLKHVDEKNVVHHTVADTIEGWANALDKLMMSYVRGYYVEFNFSKVRAEGAPLKTSGGKAPGHLDLKKALENIRSILDDAQGRQLRPIECYDIQCFAADAVLSGGIRRSATIALFSLEDGEMMAAKTGDWFPKYPWRANSNNSAVLKRGEVNKRQFKRVFKCIKEFGEPGFVFVNDYDHGFNPCVEISLNPVLVVDDYVMATIERKRAEGQFIPKTKLGDVHTGTAFCNLTEINAAACKTPGDLYEAARMASRIGTLQAAYTSFPYLGWVSEIIAEREALIGVSMTGMKDSPLVSLDPEVQTTAAGIVVCENARFAAEIGISQAARTTCVKPAGSTSLELGCVGSGIHDHHARRYLRRVTANEHDAVFQYFKSVNPHMCVKKPNGDWVIEFPIMAPEGATVKGDTSAVEFLEIVRSTQNHWVKAGTARPDSSPGMSHNVSNTVVVKEDEWDEVAEHVWAHREDFSGISFLPATGDKDYAFAPCEEISTEADEEKWNNLLRHYKPVDYAKMVESGDNTNLAGEIACSGGACEL